MNCDTTSNAEKIRRAQALREKAEQNLSAQGLNPCGELNCLDEITPVRGGKLCLGLECLDRALWELPPAIEPLRKLGIFSARLQSGWARTERVKGQYDFTALDSEVESLLAIGMQPWISLSYGNPLYYDGDVSELGAGGIGHVPLHTEEERAAWRSYVQAVVARYRGRILRYEVWNEPDVKVFFPKETNWVESYLELLRLTVPVIRQTDPAAKVIACTGGFGGLTALLEGGMGQYVDQYSFHRYSAFPEEQHAAQREALRRQRDRYAPHLLLIRGEAGCPSYNAATSFGALHDMKTSETIQAKWAGRHLLADLADPDISETSYFHAYEFVHFTRMHRYYYGALRDDYSRKPAFEVLQLLAHLFDGETKPAPERCLMMRGQQDDAAVRCCSFERNGLPLMAYWQSETLADDSPVRLTSADCFPQLQWKHPVLLDTLTRKVYALTAQEGRLTLPVTGYALVVAEAEALRGLISPELLDELLSGEEAAAEQVKQYDEG